MHTFLHLVHVSTTADDSGIIRDIALSLCSIIRMLRRSDMIMTKDRSSFFKEQIFSANGTGGMFCNPFVEATEVKISSVHATLTQRSNPRVILTLNTAV